MGAEISVHDAYVDQWFEFVNQEEDAINNKAAFFRNQKKLKDLDVQKDLFKSLKNIDALVLAVRHEAYLNLEPSKVVNSAGHPIAIIDCFGILDDDRIRQYLKMGCEVKGLGRGHIKRLKDEVIKRISED